MRKYRDHDRGSKQLMSLSRSSLHYRVSDQGRGSIVRITDVNGVPLNIGILSRPLSFFCRSLILCEMRPTSTLHNLERSSSFMKWSTRLIACSIKFSAVVFDRT